MCYAIDILSTFELSNWQSYSRFAAVMTPIMFIIQLQKRKFANDAAPSPSSFYYFIIIVKLKQTETFLQIFYANFIFFGIRLNFILFLAACNTFSLQI